MAPKKTAAKKTATKKTAAKKTTATKSTAARKTSVAKKVPKEVSDIATEVIRGKWNSGRERDILLRDAGHDPRVITREVARQLSEQ